MIDVEFSRLHSKSFVDEVGPWLDQHMPNPPLPEAQRWSLGYSIDGKVGIRFQDDRDATQFMLRWA